MKKISLIVKTIGYLFLAALIIPFIYLFMSSGIRQRLFGYEPTIYNNELDSILNSKIINQIKVVDAQRSRKRCSIYFIECDTLSELVVIETTNFKHINLGEIQIDYQNKIDLSQNRTYFVIGRNHFPDVNTILNPKESNYIKIIVKNPNQLLNEIRNDQYTYLSGRFTSLSIGNSEKCFIIAYPGSMNNELLVLECNDKIYLLLQTITNKSILEIINPRIFKIESHL
jgi:hypothetical protein